MVLQVERASILMHYADSKQGLGLWYLITLFSATFQLYRGGHRCSGRKPPLCSKSLLIPLLIIIKYFLLLLNAKGILFY